MDQYILYGFVSKETVYLLFKFFLSRLQITKNIFQTRFLTYCTDNHKSSFSDMLLSDSISNSGIPNISDKAFFFRYNSVFDIISLSSLSEKQIAGTPNAQDAIAR